MKKTDQLEITGPQKNGLQTTTDNANVDYLKLAIVNGADVDKIEKLMQMKERYDAIEARKKFFSALAGFQSEMKKVAKGKSVSFGQGKAAYSYAEMDAIVEQARPLLFKYGISYQFKIKDEADKISVTCVLTHVDGHSEETTMAGAPDTSGGKQAIQSRASAITYLERYTFNSSLGITTGNDTDANPVKPNVNDHAFAEAIQRIKKGETDLIGKMREKFALTESQNQTLSNL